MALSNFSKAKIYGLLNNTSTGSAPTTYLAFFNASNVELLPYAARPQVNFTYDTASSELRNANAPLGNAATTVTGITSVRVFDAVTGGNELFRMPAATSFGFTAGEEATFPAARLVFDLIVAAQDDDIQAIVMDKFGNWIAGSPQSGFNSVVVALFNGATEVTGVQLGARQSVAFNTTTGLSTGELDFGVASSTVSFNTARIFNNADLLVTAATLTPATVSVTAGSRAKVPVGGVSIVINP
jgi:hypothetical protein